MNSVGDSTATRRVGEPIHETRLTRSLNASIRTLLRPGAGRSLYVIAEVDAPIGRPDLAAVVVAPSIVARYMNSGIRLPHVTAAKVLLAPPGMQETSALRSANGSRVVRELERSGWTRSRASELASSIHASLAVEAKVRDWRGGLRQISRFRRTFAQSALLLPSPPKNPQFESALDAYGCGLLLEDHGKIRWAREPQDVTPPLWANLWTLELVARGLERGSAYRVTSRSNRASASA